jgi:hypothetical protein
MIKIYLHAAVAHTFLKVDASIINKLANYVVNHRIRKSQSNNHVTNLEIVTIQLNSICANGESVLLFNKTHSKLEPKKYSSLSIAYKYYNVTQQKFITCLNTQKTLSFNSERYSVVIPTILNLVILGAYFGKGLMKKIRTSYLLGAFNQVIFLNYLFTKLFLLKP